MGDEKLYRKTVNAWCLYDWAVSAFTTTVMAALFPPFFRLAAIAAGKGEAQATALWGYTAAVSLLVMALLSPVLGAMSDRAGNRKRMCALFTGIGVLATAAFVAIGRDGWALAAGLFLLANAGFAGANAFYESLLPAVARPDDLDRVSARGYAIGYVGGGILLVLNLLWVLHPAWFGMPGKAFAVKASFVSVAVWWAIFSIPFFRRVPEPPAEGPSLGLFALTREGFGRLSATFREIRRFRQVFLFLMAFWLYNDGIGTIIKMATAYGAEIGIGIPDMMAALVITQFVGIPCSFAFGALASRFGAKPLVLLGIGVYALICVFGYFMKTPLHFYILAVAVGTVQGGTQALSRSLFASMVPKEKASEFFGFFSTSDKMAGIFGPLLFSLVSNFSGASRLSIVSLIVMFIAGALLLLKVDAAEGARAAKL